MFGIGKKQSITSVKSPLALSELKKRTKIVVIDDDANAFPIETLLAEGYTIEYWSEVKSLTRLEQGEYDIIVLDIAGVATKISPDEDGLAVLHHLKTNNPDQIVVAFSGQSFDLSKQRFFRQADDTLQKPVTAIKCKQVLDNLIESRMTIQHLWSAVVSLLRNGQVPEKKIQELEDRVVRAIQTGDRADFRAVLSTITDRAEDIGKITSLGAKIIALLG